LRNEVDAIEKWKLAFTWTAIRRSLNGIPSLLARSQRCKFADVEALIRSVLDVVQKRSQGVETRLRDELIAMNLADYPSLAAYIADLEARFNKMAAFGVNITDAEQRYVLLRGLTDNYDNVKSSVLSYRDRDGNKADLAMAIYLLEDYEDNRAASSTSSRTPSLNQEVSLATFASSKGKEKVCFYFSKRGNCRRGSSCNFRHVDRASRPSTQRDPQVKRARTNNRPKPGACRKCGRDGHWAKECPSTGQDKANMLIGGDWNRVTREFVGHSLGLKMPYQQDKWLVDSASTCNVANEAFKEFSEVGPADVTITVGGDNHLSCTSVGNLLISTSLGPINLQDVRIVPGFGVNILSGPYLEKRLGLSLSSNGRTWWARRRGRQVLKGEADNAGLYWVSLTRLAPLKILQRTKENGFNASSSKKVPMGSHTPQGGLQDGGLGQNSPNPPAPPNGGRSTAILENRKSSILFTHF
jgi:gag-polypeptide of LTR copia-type/Zinc knuckle/Zinc finger C-x8-C-x5-C-x3-H type (and similar)